jgi:hypothetical protein
MNMNQLTNYREWIKVSAQTVYVAVLAAGGWRNVFPTRVPRWASRVRNYFNVTPTTLEQLPGDVSARARQHVERFKFLLDCHAVQTYNRTHQNYRPNPWGKLDPPPFKVPAGCPAKADHDVVHTGVFDEIGTRFGLSGEVYKDASGRLWYQMSAGSTIFHYGNHPKVKSVEAAYVNTIKGQNDTPVFKLMSPDNTGGSCELILKNDGYDMVVAVKQKTNIRQLIVTDPRYQGSYNYAETVQVGFAAHELRDIKPHVEQTGFYLDPLDRYSPLAHRRFPINDPQGRPLADQE